MKKSTRFGQIFLACAIVVSACLYSGCRAFLGEIYDESRTSNVAHTDGSSLHVESSNGSITVETSSGRTDVEIIAHIKATSEERLAEAKVLAERNAEGALKVHVAWPDGGRKSREGCQFKIIVPPGVVGVRLKTSNGTLQTSRLAGLADLNTSNGSIKVSNHSGSVHAKTSNGKINIREVSESVKARSSNGSLDIVMGDASIGPVDLTTSNGSVTLSVGQKFGGTLTMKTSNGSITNDVTGAKVLKAGKKNRTISLGDSNVSSSVRTSNGSITVKRMPAKGTH